MEECFVFVGVGSNYKACDLNSSDAASASLDGSLMAVVELRSGAAFMVDVYVCMAIKFSFHNYLYLWIGLIAQNIILR